MVGMVFDELILKKIPALVLIKNPENY